MINKTAYELGFELGYNDMIKNSVDKQKTNDSILSGRLATGLGGAGLGILPGLVVGTTGSGLSRVDPLRVVRWGLDGNPIMSKTRYPKVLMAAGGTLALGGLGYGAYKGWTGRKNPLPKD